MASKSPVGSAASGRKTGSIRPAVPLIYEPRPRGGGGVVHEDKPISVVQDEKESSQIVQSNEIALPTRDVQKNPAENAAIESDSRDLLPDQEALQNDATGLPKATKHEARQLDQDRLRMLRHLDESGRRLILGVDMEESVSPTQSEDSPSHAASTETSSANSNKSSAGFSQDTIYSAETVFDAPGKVYPLAYTAPTIQFGDYVRDNPPMQPMQPYTDQYMIPSHNFQGLQPFAPAWNEVPHSHTIGGQPPPTPSSASLDDGATQFDPKLAGHISSNFNVERYADVQLIVTHEQDRFGETIVFLHQVLVTRSETLRDLLDERRSNCDRKDGKLVIEMKLNDRFVTPMALANALQTCYGYPAANFLVMKPQCRIAFNRHQAIADMSEILAFAAAGHLLRLEDVALRGMQKAQEAMNWDTLETALAFGMESYVHRHESPEAQVLRSFSCLGPEGEIITIDCTTFMLGASLSFLASSFPDSWILDCSVNTLPIIDRLPVAGSLPKASLRSKLAGMQFGHFPPEMNREIADRHALISKIVLSVPLAHLCHIAAFESPAFVRQLPQVIEERERRRHVALNSDIDWQQRYLGKETSWHAVGIQESYTPTDLEDEVPILRGTLVSIYSNSGDQEEARKRDEASLGEN